MLSQKELNRIERFKERCIDNDIEILREIQLTPTIYLYVLDYLNSDMAAWAFYPKTGVEDYISAPHETETVREYAERCIDILLDKHDWFNPAVKALIEARGRRSKQH